MSEDRSSEREPSEVNPFQAPVDVEVPKAMGLGKAYWLPLVGIAAVALLVAVAENLYVGLFGIAISVFAIYHGFLYQNRVVQRGLAGEEVRRVSDLGLCACSLLLGAAGCAAGAVAFVATCFPAGFIIVSDNVGGNRAAESNNVLFVLCGICGTIAVVFVGWFLSWFVPRKPSR
ncbi:MAG: hypothetical protein ACK6DC_06190 [Planctomycetota bacterium]|jgi:hypothetical protein